MSVIIIFCDGSSYHSKLHNSDAPSIYVVVQRPG
jgi:hypothetical protein